jgi:hypothetical protein
MKRSLPVLLILTIALALTLGSGTALAKHTGGPTYVPPNQSAASQYTEAVPSAGGNTPTSHLGAGGTGGSGRSGGGPGGAAIPAKTLHQLDHSGSTGTAAASLARALAPQATHVGRRASAGASASTTGSSGASGGVTAGAPAAQVIKTLGGADAGSGIGFLLPLILVLSLVVATGLGLLRIRRAA